MTKSLAVERPPESRRGYGLGRLNPVLRLAFVFTVSVLFVFINHLPGAAVLLGLGVLLYALTPERHWKLALAAPLSGGMLLLYNTLFSPAAPGSFEWLVFTVNTAGLERGLVTGMRLTGVMLISFAWLFSTPLPEMYAGLAWIRPARPWVLGILRGIQILKREFIALTQSLIMRGLKWNSLLANIRNLVPLAAALIPRIIENSQKAAFASQSHHPAAPAGAGEIEVAGAHVRYAPHLPDVLHGVSLRVAPGEFVYLAGPNQAGKTSLLRLMGGMVSWIMGEYHGQVRVSGLLTQDHALRVLCGSVLYVAPDPFASIHGLTVGQEISFLTADEPAARAALATMGLDPAVLWERETTKLSGGQQVRLVLAGALASQARVLLLDSPMQELDAEGRAAFLEALQILRSRRRCTIVLADYFYRELVPSVDRVVVLEDGAVTAELDPDAFFADPAWLARCHLTGDVPVLPPVAVGEVVAELVDVQVSLEDNWILKGVSFTVRAGEFVAVMGPNGSGKTTAMLTLAGAIAPQRGRVVTAGRVAYVFQHAALQLVALSAADELRFGPRVLGWDAAAAQQFVAEGLAWTGLDADDCPLDLHPADVRMLAIAAANTAPCAYVLDEPTVGLDAAGIARLYGFIARLRQAGVGVVVITHDAALTAQADRVVVIRDGRVESEAGPA